MLISGLCWVGILFLGLWFLSGYLASVTGQSVAYFLGLFNWCVHRKCIGGREEEEKVIVIHWGMDWRIRSQEL